MATYKVFLSHQSGDKPFVTALAECLRRNGVEVFFDTWDIRPGDSIPGEIEAGLSSADIFLYVLSPAALASKWVQAEYHASLYRKLNDHSIRIIPILRHDVEAPPLIAPLKRIDFRKVSLPLNCDPAAGGPFGELMSAIFRLPIKPPLGLPHPALASYEFYFQKMKNTPPGESDSWEIGFKNITDAPLHNFEFALVFDSPVADVRYDFNRSSANFTGGNGLSADGLRYHWLGNQIMGNGGWIVFTLRSVVTPEIRRISTRFLGRSPDGKTLIPPDPDGLR
ncbi:MAG TPA: toll/interleukin-1 receptor domain-containing protein [Desulfomonilaceae bacterium]|nr:toll/interleukin-1 receptor domain-containing protein [Desulfomonilaceae bacterium]